MARARRLARAAWARVVFACALAGLPALPGVAHAAVESTEGGILFSYTDPAAQSVSLAGSFNEWNTTATPLTDADGDGVWTAVVALAAGSHQYKFVVNGGTWMADPDNPLTGGDFGNSLVVVAAGGGIDRTGGVAATPTVPSGTPAVSNTAAHSRVYLGGFFRLQMQSASDIDGDARLRLERPDDQFNLDATANLSEKLWGSVRLQLQTGSGGSNELSAELYKAQSNFVADDFRMQAYYNDEVFETDDPFELLGHTDLRGTIGEEHRPFGQGTQGLVFRAKPWGGEVAALYADTFDEDIFNPGEPTVLNPRKEGLNQNTGTDVALLRWTQPLGERRLGLTYRGEMSDWWVNFTSAENPYPAELTAHRAADPREDQDKSDNYELANDRHVVAFDVASPVPLVSELGARGQLGYEWYAARWDLGNRESIQGDNFTDGSIDVPIGNERGYRAELELNKRWRDLAGTLSHEIRYGEGMDAGENFITYRIVPGSVFSDRDYFGDAGQVGDYNDVNGSDAVDVLRLGPRPERVTHITELDLSWKRGAWQAQLEYDRRRENLGYTDLLGAGPADLNRWTWRTSPRLYWTPFAKPEHFLGFETEFLRTRDPVEFAEAGASSPTSPLPGQGNGGLLRLNSTELILRGLVPAWKLQGRDISFRFDLRRIDYSGNEQLRDASDRPLDLDRDFFAPFAALVYRPADAVQVQVGYGVDPTFYRVISPEGWPNGRQQFREDWLFERRLDPYAPANVLKAEEALEDRNQIVLNALITF